MLLINPDLLHQSSDELNSALAPDVLSAHRCQSCRDLSVACAS